MQQTLEPLSHAEVKPRSQSWLILLDILFYLLLVASLVGFVLYLYSYRIIIIIDLPILLVGAGATIVIFVD